MNHARRLRSDRSVQLKLITGLINREVHFHKSFNCSPRCSESFLHFKLTQASCIGGDLFDLSIGKGNLMLMLVK
jgi:hypothetical protein